MNKISARLDEITTKCCEAMFPDLDLKIESELPTAPEQEELVAVIGFSGDNIRGALGIVALPEIIASTHPLKDSGIEITAEHLADWVAEMANQLLGRIKRELLTYNLTLWLASPVVLRGISVRISSTKNNTVRKYSFVEQGGPLSVWIDFQYDKEIVLEESEEENEERLEAGDYLFLSDD